MPSLPKPKARRVALVTGASRGIGAATAVALAGARFDVVITATSLPALKKTEEACQRLGAKVLSLAHDVSQRRDADRIARAVTRALGPLDVLVNNAGIVIRRSVDKMSDDDFDHVLAVNTSGPFYLVRRFLPGMLRRKVGRIINVSSISATMGTPGLSGYCASKWALDGLTRALAEETRGRGVFVASVLPGSVDTDMLKGSGFPPAMQPGDVARVIRYLATGAPQAMHGARVEVFG